MHNVNVLKNYSSDPVTFGRPNSERGQGQTGENSHLTEYCENLLGILKKIYTIQ